MNPFLSFEPVDGPCWVESDPDSFPSTLSQWMDCSLSLDSSATHFIFVISGKARIEFQGGRYPIKAGMYAAVPGSCRIEGGSGIAITRHGFIGLFHLGGPVEQVGRLRYIDGCTDSLLIPPVRWGDPCLNLLHIPENTHQSQHTHPSHRVGVILSGSGECITPDSSYPLHAGMVFVIPADSRHSFHTQGNALRVLAYHPDSDFGPTDEVHPMVNRTILSKS